jgi:hypothetical protein
MSTTKHSTVRQLPDGSYRYGDQTGTGWVVFAGCMLLLLAALNMVEGIAAASSSSFFARNPHFIVGDLQTYGWVLIGVAIVQGLTGLAVLLQIGGARWVGVGIAGINAIVQLTFIPAHPFWALAVFGVDILVIHGLVTHGWRRWYD